MANAYHHGDLHNALISTGLSLLADQSAEGLSLRELARRNGVSATAVYRHFPNKGALLAALAHEGLQRLAAAQREAYKAAGGGEAGFLATGKAYVQFAVANPALFRLIYAAPRAAALDHQGDPERSPMAFLKQNVAARLASGANEHDLRVEALHHWSLAHGLAMLILDKQVPADEELIASLFAVAER